MPSFNRRTFIKLFAGSLFSTAGIYQVARQFFLSKEDLLSLAEVALPSTLSSKERQRAVYAFLQWKNEAPPRFLHPDWRDMREINIHAFLFYRQTFSSLPPAAKKKVTKQCMARKRTREHLVTRLSNHYFQSIDGINLIHQLRVDAFSSRRLSDSCQLPKELT